MKALALVITTATARPSLESLAFCCTRDQLQIVLDRPDGHPIQILRCR